MPKLEPKFLHIRVKGHIVMHGYDSNNKEIQETVTADGYQDKIVAVERIQSITEKYILTTSAAGRFIYWEYEGGLKKLSAQMKKVGLL